MFRYIVDSAIATQRTNSEAYPQQNAVRLDCELKDKNYPQYIDRSTADNFQSNLFSIKRLHWLMYHTIPSDEFAH